MRSGFYADCGSDPTCISFANSLQSCPQNSQPEPSSEPSQPTSEPSFEIIDNDQDGVPVEEDCDDNNPLVSPFMEEICDGIDNDCDLVIDNSTTDGDLWYRDFDLDGFASSSSVSLNSCGPINGFSNILGDCNDNDPNISPVAVEICDGVDNNCNGDVDADDASISPDFLVDYYIDTDQDGFGIGEIQEPVPPLHFLVS